MVPVGPRKPDEQVQAVPEQVDHAGLDGRLRKHRQDRVREAFQAVNDRDQDILDATVAGSFMTLSQNLAP